MEREISRHMFEHGLNFVQGFLKNNELEIPPMVHER
jgi:hypothetical protein